MPKDQQTTGQRLYRVGEQLRADIAVYPTAQEDAPAPSMSECRHAVLAIHNVTMEGGPGYVVYDRLLSRLVNGVFYTLEDALRVAQYYNKDEGAPQDMAPNGDALGLVYPEPAD
jgi:hypothetical protein